MAKIVKTSMWAGLVALGLCTPACAPSAEDALTRRAGSALSASQDLRVGAQPGDTQHVVVMAYEPWHGAQNPHVANGGRPPGYRNTVIHPTQTAGLFDVDLGPRSTTWGDHDNTTHTITDDLHYRHYDSGNAATIRWHRDQIKALGADALLVDLTNQLSLFPSSFDWRDGSASNAVEQTFLNIKNIYETYSSDADDRGIADLKIIPLVGAYDSQFFGTDSGVGPLLSQWRLLMEANPGHSVLYADDDGRYKPLVVLYVAVWPGSAPGSLVAAARAVLDSTMPSGDQTYAQYFTIRVMGGFLDSAGDGRFRGPSNSGTPAQRSQDPDDAGLSYWSWVDRYAGGFRPTFGASSTLAGQGRVEAFTATNAAISAQGGLGVDVEGKFCNATCTANVDMTRCMETHRLDIPLSCSWGRPADGGLPLYYPPDLTLRRSADGVWAFQRYMAIARALRPTFLIVSQWNQFEQTDQGFDFQTTNDLEPANWGVDPLTGQVVDDWAPYDMARAEIAAYRASLVDTGLNVNGSLRSAVNPGRPAIIGFYAEPSSIVVNGYGPLLQNFGIGNALPWPQLDVHNGGTLLGETFGPAAGQDTTLSVALAGGLYTAAVGAHDGRGGVGLVEVNDTSSPARGFSNFSGRAYFDPAIPSGMPIAGFITRGGWRRVLVIGRGGSLGHFGLTPQLGSPELRVYAEGPSRLIATSLGQPNQQFDPWLSRVAGDVSGFALASDDAAVVLDVNDGSYTAVMTGSGAGHGMVEVYYVRN